MDQSQQIYRLIVETAREGIWIIDEQNNVSFLNQRMAEMLGYSINEIMNKPIFDFLDHDLKEQAIDNIRRSKNGEVKQHEFMFRKKDGGPLWSLLKTNPLFENGIYKGSLAMVTDITQRKKSESELIAHEQQLNLIYNSATDAMWLIDIEPGKKYRFESVNKSFKMFTGYTEEQVVGNLLENVLPPRARELVRTNYAHAIETSEPVDYIEKAPFPAGERVSEIRVIPVKNNAGLVTKLVCMGNDITGRTVAEEQNRLHEMQIAKAIINTQEQERMQIGLELHDNVNQILCGALLSLGIIKELPAKRSPEFVNKAKDYISNAIKEIRSLSHRLSPVSFDSISFKVAVEDLIDAVNILSPYTVSLEFDNFDFADETDLKLNLYRILQEQLNNITKYSEADRLEIHFSLVGNTVKFRIYDNGKGFDINAERKGIGINNIKMRTESFGGKFSLNTSPGNGCEIIILIPLKNKRV